MSSLDDKVVNILPQGNLEEDLSLIESGYVLEAMMQLQELPREARKEMNRNFVKSISAYKGGSIVGKKRDHRILDPLIFFRQNSEK